LDFDNPAFKTVEDESGQDIRGLRSYTVSDIPSSSVGAIEWHMIRTEYVTALAGAVIWQCIDLDGREREFTLDGSKAIIQPPGILHIYQALQPNTRLQVTCNTLFVPEDPRTHDTFSRDIFYELRNHIMQNGR
jgi:dTDP-4-dehydrorhamnose 3,5-epimerase-like enzyme